MRDVIPFSILVTAGGTREDIDTVRSIANHATGRLGSLIADAFLQGGAKVTYLCGETSLLPSSQGCEVIKIRGVCQLAQTMDMLLKRNLYDCVIHSMAVSDFTPHAVAAVDEIAEAAGRELSGACLSGEEISSRIRNIILSAKQPSDKKISSKTPYLMMTLKQTPKVIGLIKPIQPQTLLVGFKLLSGASEFELLNAGFKLIADNGCDYVLANDLSGVSGDSHKAIFMDNKGIICKAGTKPEIAQIIFRTVMERIDTAR